MNILYLSTHEILEYDEIKLFTEIGHDVVSYGAYSNPLNDGIMRPAVKGLYMNNELYSCVMQSSKDNLHDKLIEWCDIIIVMHKHEWIVNNWERIKHKRVIWRSIGQSIPQIEEILQKYRKDGLQIVRYSPYEKRIFNYAGQDAVIRFYKDQNEYNNWNGEIAEVMTIAQSMPHKSRARELNWKAFRVATKGLPTKLFGPGNEEAGAMWGGQISYEDLKKVLRDYRVYFYTGTMPASYTLGFIEALMTGTPIVAIGNRLGYDPFYKQDTYEVADLLETGVNGFVSDDVDVLHRYVKDLLEQPKTALTISMKGRELAKELFGKEKIMNQWRLFLR